MTKNLLILTLLIGTGIPATARADLLFGVLNVTGTAQVSLGNVGFLANQLFINSPAAAQQGGFTALAGTTATIQNLKNPPDATGPLNVPNFITFTSAPNLSITLTFLLPGIDGAAGCSATPPAAGQQCTPNTPNQSPFNLFNTSATSSTASFNILGLEVDSITGKSTPITGAFSQPFTNMNYQQILATIAGGGTVTTAFGAQFATTAPEPDSLMLMAIGLGGVLVGLAGRRRRPRNE